MSKTFTIYRSSAGSGKTRTLAKEYLKLALRLRAHYFKHILAVTFTNKATQEMKDRILAYLDEFANGKPGDLAEELKSELKLVSLTFQQYAQETQSAILHDYSHFSISTIDAFFQKVIRAFTREAGLEGDYRLEIDQDAVLEEVINNLIDELGRNKELTEWVVEFAGENLANDRPWDVRTSLLDFSKEIFREEFKIIEDDVIAKTSQPKYFRNLQARLGEIRSRFVSTLCTLARETLQILSRQPWDTNDLHNGSRAGLYSFFESWASSKKVKDLKEPTKRVLAFATDAKEWPSKKTPHAAAILKTAEVELVPRLQRMLEIYEKGITEALSAEVAAQNLYVFGLVADISRKLKEFKHENNLMLLADAPKFLNGVIQDSDTPFVYEKVGSFYKNYLIDEFQDTSGLQWKNFLPLLTNSLDQGFASLVVGDVKQAIYRWRGGDLSLLNENVEKNIGAERSEIKNLSSNFRSSTSIVDFNNALFEAASSIVTSETQHPLSTAAYTDVSQLRSSSSEGFVRIRFISDETDGPKWKEKALDEIPLYLEQLQSIGIPLKDIAIVVRKNEEGQDVVNHLLNYKLSDKAKPEFRYDVVSSESLRLDSAATVNLLEAAMKYLLNPADDVARAQLAFEFARLFDPEKPATEVFSVTNQSVFESSLPQEFTKEKSALKKLPLFELTETLIQIFRLGQYPGEIAYLLAFQNIVLDFFTRERNDLGAFLEWWEINKKKKSIPVSGDVDAAQIISIHKSKGLQFRYVLIPFCSWSMDHDGFKSPQLWVPSAESEFADAGYIPVKYSSTLERTHFKTFYRDEMVRTYLDNLNLLYVALTRAEAGLIVMAPDLQASRKSVASILFKSITDSEVLRQFYSETTSVLNMGNWYAIADRATTVSPSVRLDSYPVSRWREKLVIRQNAKDFFNREEDERREKINYGLHLHAVLSAIVREKDIPSVMNDLHLSGRITADEHSELTTNIEGLLKNEKIRSWFSDEWDVRTEVPILLPQGSENRIDRLMVKGRKAVVVDFKTGEPVKTDQKQVMEYLDILRKMNFVDVEGYLLYVRTGEVISVAPVKSRLIKRKDDSQLDLGI